LADLRMSRAWRVTVAVLVVVLLVSVGYVVVRWDDIWDCSDIGQCFLE